MKTTFFTIISVVVLGLVLANVSRANSDEVFQSFVVANGGTLVLESDAGAIHVESHAKETVEVQVENKSGRDHFTVNFKQSGNNINIKGELENTGWWGSSGKIKYIVKVPEEYNLELKTGGGSISLNNLKGQVNARTSGGSIKLGKIVGDVQAKTSGGSIRVDEVAGNIEAHTSGGSIKATLSQQPTANCRLTTSGGSVTAYLAANTAVNLVAKTSGGGVRSDFKVDGTVSKKSIDGKINGGGPELYLRTSGGSVSIRKI